MKKLILLLLSFTLSNFADDLSINQKTKYLMADKLIFEEKFENDISKDKNWFLRKSDWIPNESILKGTPLPEGNGAFLRLHSLEKEGVLPENYIMNFKFKVGDEVNGPSIGHRISLGHYCFKVNWRGPEGIIINIMHGTALTDPSFLIQKGQWYDVTIECKNDEVVFSFANGPSYYAQHEVNKSKPAGWEYFINKKEHGYLDDLRVWSLSEHTHQNWEETKAGIMKDGKGFKQSDNPDFKITKKPKPKKKKSDSLQQRPVAGY